MPHNPSTTPGAQRYTTQGPLGIAGQLTESRKFDQSDLIILEARSLAPLDVILTANQRKIRVTDPEPKLNTLQESPIRFPITVVSSTTNFDEDTFGLADGLATFLQANDSLQSQDIWANNAGTTFSTTKFAQPALETMLIVSVELGALGGSNAKIVVRRGNGKNTAASGVEPLTTSMVLNKVGNTIPDNGVSPEPISFEKGQVSNFCQFRSMTWAESTQERFLDSYAKLSMGDKANMKREQFFREREYSSIMGRQSKFIVEGNKVQYFEGGIVERISTAATSHDGETRLFDNAGAFSFPKLRENTEVLYRVGNQRRVKDWFCGGKFFTKLNDDLETNLVINDAASERYGWNVFELELGHGLALLHRHPIFTDMSTTGQGDFALDVLMVDLDYIWQLEYIPPQLKVGVQNNNVHGRTDELFASKSTHIVNDDAHGYLFGITA